jgi:ribosomal RNA-processing protein 8
LFEFTKVAAVPQGAVKGEKGWEGRINAGSEILRACVYKKR